MGQARLKVNIIMDGVNYAVGTVVDKTKFPSHLRKPENFEPAGAEPPPVEEFPPPEEEQGFT